MQVIIYIFFFCDIWFALVCTLIYPPLICFILGVIQQLRGQNYTIFCKDFQAFRVGLVRRLTSAVFWVFVPGIKPLCTIDSYSDNFES